MKKISFLTILVFSISLAFGQINWIKTGTNDLHKPAIEVIDQNAEGLTIKLSLNSYGLIEVETPRGTEYVIKSPDCPNNYQKGSADLPFKTTAIAIPDLGGFKYEVIATDYILIEDISIAPSKGSLMRNIDPATVPYEYGRDYQINEFIPQIQAYTGEPYIIRNLRGVDVNFYPFSYNAVSRELKIFTEVTIKIKYTDDSFANELTHTMASITDEFDKIYSRKFINYKSDAKYTALEEGTPGKFLIISAPSYASAMTNFINWKHEKGIQTEMVLMSDIGTTATQLKAYIQNYYNENDLSYVLLVGDAADIPTMTVSSNDSDNGYTYLAGGDGYADIFIGRFSGNSLADIQTQAVRMIHYERDITTSDTWLTNAFGSASNEGEGMGHDGGESDETHMNNIKTDLQNYGYTVTNVNQNGGSNAQITAAFNAGIGVANYVGHGDWNQWVNTSFMNANVDALTNAKKLGFAWSVACVNGDFKTKTCFAEVWMRATHNGEPTGAIGFLASTINQSWTEPMTGQDEMNDILIESYANNIKRTFGGLSFNGMFQMIEEGGQGQVMADTWTLFGDPSLMVRSKVPTTMTISHLPTIPVGQSAFSVDCNTDGALVSLTHVVDNEVVIAGYAYVNGGSVDVDITPFDAPGTMKITVTAYNKVTYQQEVLIIVPDGPYVVKDVFTINDETGNNNSMADYNETIKINQSLRNVGVELAIAVNASISTTHPDIEITENTADFGNIGIDETITVNNAYTLVIPDGIQDQTVIPIVLSISDSESNEWQASYSIIANAPAWTLSFVAVDDSESGNGNGFLDPGETVNIIVRATNNGHAAAEEGSINISSENENVTILTNSQTVNQTDAESFVEFEFTISVDESTPTGETVCFLFELSTGMYSASTSTCIPAGLQIEDWESNSFANFAWQNNSSYPWTIVSDIVYEGSYALKSGNVPASGGESSLIINVSVLNDDSIEFYKKVSCEEASSWWGQLTYWDYLAFYINGTMQDQWAGEVDWSQESYNVAAGSHELKWVYVKDDYVDAGSDCAWIDYIKLPSHDITITVINTDREVFENQVNVYPNPASDIVYVNVDTDKTTNAKIVVYGLNGQVVYQYPEMFKLYKGENSILLNTSDFSNGLYIIQLTTSENTYHRNLIINK